jgi:DNA-binding transcriptional regulator YiaG
MNKTIFDYISEEENSYQTTGVPIADGLNWSMADHIKKTIYAKDSKYTKGVNGDGSRPYHNIIVPIAKLSYRSEGFDVKDIEMYVDNPDKYHLSFLTKKYHNNWALDNHIDEFIDSVVIQSFDFGGCLVKKNKSEVEVVPLQSIAFCDQTDIKSGPICIKHMYSVEDMEAKRGIWDDEAIDEALAMSKDEMSNGNTSTKAKTPGKYVEVYELHGMLSKTWIEDTDENENKYSRQTHIVTYYTKSDGQKQGITFFKKDNAKDIFKFYRRGGKSMIIYGRALNKGGIEELFEPQMWINYSMIQLKDMLDVASLMLLKTTDPEIAGQNNIKDLSPGEIIKMREGSDLAQVQFQVINETAFYNSVSKWESLARATGSASESSLAVTPTSGTPFALEQLKTANGLQEHDYQRNKVADFIGEVYRDWTIPILSVEMRKGYKWLDELSVDELQATVSNVVENETNNKIKTEMINGRLMTQEEIDQYKALVEQMHMGKSTKFIELLEDELEGLPMDIKINVAGRQKDLSKMTDKLTNIFREVIVNPQVLQDPNAKKAFNEILEYSGLNPINFKVSTIQQPALEAIAPVATT